MTVSAEIGTGLYSVGEASRLIRVPRRTVSRWAAGYVDQLRDFLKRYRPVIQGSTDGCLTFGDLVELMFVREFRSAGVPLETIRLAAEKYAKEWSSPYPFASQEFAVGGRDLLAQEGGEWRTCLSGQGVLFLDNVASRLVHLDGLASEWRPLGMDRAVVLNPARSFGRPIDAGSGTDTFTIFRAVKAGSSVEETAHWYGTTEQAVLDAAEFERQYNPVRNHGDLLAG